MSSLLQSSRCLSSLRLTRRPWDTSRGVLGGLRSRDQGDAARSTDMNSVRGREDLDDRESNLWKGVRPVKAGMFSGSQTHRGKSQKPRSLSHVRGGNEGDEAD